MVRIFEQGDIIFMDFNPQAGHEQSGRRPAVVVSNHILNRFSSTIMVCPIKNTNKKHPFHIALNGKTKTTGVILCDQAKMLDVNARHAEYEEALPEDILDEVLDVLASFIEKI